MGCNKEHWCEQCNDRLIHQWNRGKHESSSAFGQFIHEFVTKKTSFVDVDMQCLNGEPFEKLEVQVQQLHFTFGEPPIFRVFEHKPQGAGLTQAEEWMLPIWVQLVEFGKRSGVINAKSGVFIVESDPPFELFLITWHRPAGPISQEMKQEKFLRWMGGPQ